MKPYILALEETDPLQLFAALRALPYSLLFDSADSAHQSNRYAFIAALPVETIEAKNGCITITSAANQQETEGDPFTIVQERLAHYRIAEEKIRELPPFQGGAAGFFGYDLGRYLEKIPSRAYDNPNMPDMAVGIYDQVIAFDLHHDRAWIITHAREEFEASIKQRNLLHVTQRDQEDIKAFKGVDLPWEMSFDPFQYAGHVRRIIEYIKDGDIFQANLTQRFDAVLPDNFDPFAHYLHLRSMNPAPFAGFMNFGGGLQLSSASPERFLTVQGRMVETRPIKGTRPRAGDRAMDMLYRNHLENSDKDRAENTMIVDLLRNDLAKVCEATSIEVSSLCEVESFASVHHLVSTIEGKLKEDQSPLDLLRACFPGGSITGAPKIRAMEIIEELEPTRRGPYCGSMAYIGFDGSMDSNILIRTLVFENDRVSFQTGGGIVADSNPDSEYQECFDKAHALFRSFEGAEYEIDEEIIKMAESA
jgi:para-aminobenzoate synthetase component 1